MFAPFGIIVAMGPARSGHEKTVADFDPDAVFKSPLTEQDLMRVDARLRADVPVAVIASRPNMVELRALSASARRFGVAATVVRTTLPIGALLRRDGCRADWAAHMAVSDSVLAAAGFTVIDSDRFGGMVPLDGDGRHLAGGFDIIGDVHGELGELSELLAHLGYDRAFRHGKGRIPVFVGDLVDKGPESLSVLRLVRSAHAAGRALMVRGNHEDRLARVLLGVLRSRDRTQALEQAIRSAKPDLAPTLRQIRDAGCVESGEAAEIVHFIKRLPLRLVLDGGRLVVVHAAEPPEGSNEETTLRWCCYGPPLADRHMDWRTARRAYTLVHGHDTVDVARDVGGIVDLDTGCGEGGELSAYTWPQRRIVSARVRVES